MQTCRVERKRYATPYALDATDSFDATPDALDATDRFDATPDALEATDKLVLCDRREPQLRML
jgi:hypothetical protein